MKLNNLSEPNKPKVVIIGLDGAVWHLLDKLMDHGLLPNLKKIKEEGIYSKLRTTLPPVTAPAWVSFATGKNPGKHGCFDFVIPKDKIDNYCPVSSETIQGKTFYEILQEKGKECILVNLPVTYPPRIPEVVITSLLTRGENFVFPKELINEIPAFKNYKLAPEGSKEKKMKEHVADIRQIEKTRFECAKELFKKDWDLFFILFSGTDWIQHSKFYDLEHNDVEQERKAIKIYQEIDQYVGWFKDHLADDTKLLIMSDHGFCSLDGVFFLNQWLEKENYLKFQASNKKYIDFGQVAESRKKSSSKGVNFYLSGLTRFLWKYPKFFQMAKKTYDKVKKIMPINVQQDFGFDHSQTIAYSLSNLIYLNRKDRFENGVIETETEYQEIKKKLMAKLSKIKDPDTGKLVFDKIIDAHQSYNGKEIEKGPDIIVYSSNFLIKSIPGPLFIKGKFQYHSLDGIFIGSSKGVNKKDELESKSILDIVPTIFKTFGMEIPPDLDGRPIEEMFK